MVVELVVIVFQCSELLVCGFVTVLAFRFDRHFQECWCLWHVPTPKFSYYFLDLFSYVGSRGKVPL